MRKPDAVKVQDPDHGEILRVSVRTLVEFILRSGDIDNRTGGTSDQEAMQMGSRLHRKIQGRMGSEYAAEVSLQGIFLCRYSPEDGLWGAFHGKPDELNASADAQSPLTGEFHPIGKASSDGEVLSAAVSFPAGEVLSAEEDFEDTFYIRVEGRADGIITKKGEIPVIDEIKGLLRSLDYLEEPVGVHLAQAKCYAYFYASDHELETVGVRMSYVNLETEEMKYFSYTFSRVELETWFLQVLGEYRKWAGAQRAWIRLRTASIRRTDFPFAWREGQKKLAGDVYRTIHRRKILFLQAPTGVGKTLSTVFPAVKAMGEGLGGPVFYLTARTIARTVASSAFDQLRGEGLRFKSVVLTAKEKICPLEETLCNPEDCPYAKGHFDRINHAVYELLCRRDAFDREVISQAAQEYRVCPFELSLDLSSWADGIIADYNYVFHPRSRLKRFFAEGVKGDYIFLIDEAHNLVDRGRDMYSAELCKEDILAVKKAVKMYSPRLSRALDRVNRKLLEFKRACGAPEYSQTDTDSAGSGAADGKTDIDNSGNAGSGSSIFVQATGEAGSVLQGLGTLPILLLNLSGTMEEFLDETGRKGETGNHIKCPKEVREQVLELYFLILTFLDTCDRLDQYYRIYDQIHGDGSFHLKLYCVNPAGNLQECMDKGRSSILFSATLLPIAYHKELLCTRQDTYAVYARSVFDPARLQVLVGLDVSSRFGRRGPDQYRRIAKYIHGAMEGRPGNYLVFLPSYRMLEDVADAFEEECTQPEQSLFPCRILRQKARMKEEEREAFLQEFVKGDKYDSCGPQEAGTGERMRLGGEASLVGFCVMGSIFGEGIDLRRESLIGVIIVGTGIPMVCLEQELLRRYYDSQGKDGFFYAYQCPGMNRVLQAAGRVIRTEEDAGVVLLLDDRFTQERYRSMFPREWQEMALCRAGTVSVLLTDFWKKQDGCAAEGDAEKSCQSGISVCDEESL